MTDATNLLYKLRNMQFIII